MFSSPSRPEDSPRSRLPTWTPERERRAVRLYLAEGFTAADVANALGAGISRASVVGKMRRLGCLKRDIRAVSPVRAAKAERKACRSAARRVTVRLPQPPPRALPPLRTIGPTGSMAPLACLPAGACRWPIDDPGPGRMHLALFCGGPAAPHVYCAAHRALADANGQPSVLGQR